MSTWVYFIILVSLAIRTYRISKEQKKHDLDAHFANSEIERLRPYIRELEARLLEVDA